MRAGKAVTSARRLAVRGRESMLRLLQRFSLAASALAPHYAVNRQWLEAAAACTATVARHTAARGSSSRQFIRDASALSRAIVDMSVAAGPAAGAGWVPLFPQDPRRLRSAALKAIESARGAQEPDLAERVARLLYQSDPKSPSTARALVAILEARGDHQEAYRVRRAHMRSRGGSAAALESAEAQAIHASAELVATADLASASEPGEAAAVAWAATRAAYGMGVVTDPPVVAAADAALKLEALATPRILPDAAATVAAFGLADLRELVRGRSVTVAAGQLPSRGRNGDIVVLVDPEPRASLSTTGTLVVVVTRTQGGDWTSPAAVRLILGEDHAAWRRQVRLNLRPFAQERFGDDSLRWPPDIIGWDRAATTERGLVHALAVLLRDHCGPAQLDLPQSPAVEEATA